MYGYMKEKKKSKESQLPFVVLEDPAWIEDKTKYLFGLRCKNPVSVLLDCNKNLILPV